MRAYPIMDHGVTGWFGTKLAPNLSARVGSFHRLLFGSGLFPHFFDFLKGQRLHEAFFAAKQRERSHIHSVQNSHDFLSFSPRKYVLCQLILVLLACGYRKLVFGVGHNRIGPYLTNRIFALLRIMSLVADDIVAQPVDAGTA